MLEYQSMLKKEDSGETKPFVTRVDSRCCEVWHKGDIVQATLRGKLFEDKNKDKNPIAVGDFVSLIQEGDDWAIDTILPRQNTFARRAAGEEQDLRQVLATNVTQVLIVNSLGVPPFSSMVADRILAACTAADIPSVLIINKVDLGKASKIKRIAETYRNCGTQTLLTSANDHTGIKELGAIIKNQTSVLYGLSGVGKSSLMNCLEPGLDIKTRQVSNTLKSGKHTTTHSQWYPLKNGGSVIDTPGVRKFRPVGIAPTDLRIYFKDIHIFGKNCDYYDCTHREEPGCKVLEALNAKLLSPSRYRSYLAILEELEEVYGGTGRNEEKEGPNHKARR